MTVKFGSVWKDCGFLPGWPPFLVVPRGGIGLVYLNSVKTLDVVNDLKFDRSHLKVHLVGQNEVSKYLSKYRDNFPSRVGNDVSALYGGILNTMQFHSVLLAIEGAHPGKTAGIDYVHNRQSAKLDVFTAGYNSAEVSFRFIRHQNADGELKAGTIHAPSEARGWMEALQRLYQPSANVELTLKSAEYANVNRPLGDKIGAQNFRQYIMPLRDPTADITVFFAGGYKGTDDPLGEAFPDVNCAVIDDAPLQYIAPPRNWPNQGMTADDYKYAYPLHRSASERDLLIVLAHEIAHLLGAGHNNVEDNLMSMGRQDFKFDKGTVRAIAS